MKLKFLTVTTDGSGESYAKNYGDGTMLFDNGTDRALDLQPNTTYIVRADLIALPKGYRLLTDKERELYSLKTLPKAQVLVGGEWADARHGINFAGSWTKDFTYTVPINTVFPDTRKQEQIDRLARRLVELSDVLGALKIELGELKS